MMANRDRTLVIIGGGEDRSQDKVILSEVARRVGGGKLVVTTVAMPNPGGLFEQYDRAFRALGVRHVYKLEVNERREATEEGKLRVLDDAVGVFFTGGDQMKITSQVGDTAVFARIHEIYNDGGVIAGTSAGASAMCETMLVSGNDQESFTVGGSTRMAPGLGLIGGVIIDQHFTERGRIGRLVGAVAQNPKNIGVGIDEQTAVVVEGGRSFYVLGSGAVYVIDGSGVAYSNIAEEEANKTLSIYGLGLHVLSQGDRFDLDSRRPNRLPEEKAKRLPEKQPE
jgi:cyanophycinase